MAWVGDNEKVTMRLNCHGRRLSPHCSFCPLSDGTFFVVMLAKWSINSGSIVSTGLEFPQATVLAEPWVSLSELAIILWNNRLEARIGIVTWNVNNIWEVLQDSTSANKSQAESTEAITSCEPPAQLHSPDIVHLPPIAYNWYWWISVQGKHKNPCIFIGSAAYWCISRQTLGDFTKESRLNLLRPNDDYSCRPFALVEGCTATLMFRI